MLKNRLQRSIRQYRPFLIFLAKFFLSYVVLTGFYRLFLSAFGGQIDPITSSVAFQSEWLLKLFNADASSVLHDSGVFEMMMYNQKYVARIIEGCNAVSVMILFAAFVIAFSGKFRHTLLFIICGCVIIHILNIIRISLLCPALFHYPEYEHLLHGVVFPLFIYSVVFSLWVIWVNRYSSHAKK